MRRAEGVAPYERRFCLFLASPDLWVKGSLRKRATDKPPFVQRGERFLPCIAVYPLENKKIFLKNAEDFLILCVIYM